MRGTDISNRKSRESPSSMCEFTITKLVLLIQIFTYICGPRVRYFYYDYEH